MPATITLVPAAADHIPLMWAILTRALRAQAAGLYAAEVLARWLSSPFPASYPDLLAAAQRTTFDWPAGIPPSRRLSSGKARLGKRRAAKHFPRNLRWQKRFIAD